MGIFLSVWIVFQTLLELCLHSETSQCVSQKIAATLKYAACVWSGGVQGALCLEVLESQSREVLSFILLRSRHHEIYYFWKIYLSIKEPLHCVAEFLQDWVEGKRALFIEFWGLVGIVFLKDKVTLCLASFQTPQRMLWNSWVKSKFIIF